MSKKERQNPRLNKAVNILKPVIILSLIIYITYSIWPTTQFIFDIFRFSESRRIKSLEAVRSEVTQARRNWVEADIDDYIVEVWEDGCGLDDVMGLIVQNGELIFAQETLIGGDYSGIEIPQKIDYAELEEHRRCLEISEQEFKDLSCCSQDMYGCYKWREYNKLTLESLLSRVEELSAKSDLGGYFLSAKFDPELGYVRKFIYRSMNYGWSSSTCRPSYEYRNFQILDNVTWGPSDTVP